MVKILRLNITLIERRYKDALDMNKIGDVLIKKSDIGSMDGLTEIIEWCTANRSQEYVPKNPETL